ncbi:MAG: MBL fold metallo-hydrolase [Terrimicrobiaceae bacterium]|nr:MBL fold metallo-hydrolase [Terrimicrobiaceae bacterium]
MTARFCLLAAALAFTLAGCGGGSIQKATGQPQRLIRVDWYGEECFRIQSALGIALLTNPFAEGATDFAQPKNLHPEVILITSENSRANNVDMVDNTPHILRGSVGVGSNSIAGLRIQGVPVFKNPETQDVDGMNVIYRWSMDGLRFCFLGQLGTLPTAADLSRLGKVDVLFLPASGTDLTDSQRQQIIAQLRPQIIIPMGSIAAMNRFASGYSAVFRLNASAALLSREALPAVPTVVLFRAP